MIRQLSAMMLLVPLTMCQSLNPMENIFSDYCTTVQPIKPSRKDTNDTLRQIARENAKYRDFCATPGK